MILNPVLPGFHPDPSILRVGADYYLATSTFEWYPGVRVHHSRDLVHWRPIGGILTERRLLDLTGVPDSGGVWAPDLSYTDGRFHLVYGVVDNYAFGFKDVGNFLVTAPTIDGPWSDPVPLPGRGFDAALFHDDDGTTWLLNMVFDSRPGRGFSGIELQQLKAGRPVGDPQLIFPGTKVGLTEGPHLYRVDGWYYLLVAEGGTGYEHGALVARSRSLFGPYEPDPAGPMFTARHDPTLPLQKAGHGSLVRTQSGEWYVAHLAARPYTPRGRCVLGRETALQRVDWVDGWPRVPGGIAVERVPAPHLPGGGAVDPQAPDGPLGPRWSTLRRPATPDWLSTVDGSTRVHGGQSPYGLRAPSLVGRPVTATRCALTATMRFRPASGHQAAGITAYYNSRNWYFLAMTTDGLVLTASDRGRRREWRLSDRLAGAVTLRAELDGAALRFSYDAGAGWQAASGERAAPLELDATILSDEHADEVVDGQARTFGFTGAFLGVWVQDLAAEGCFADFKDVTYEER